MTEPAIPSLPSKVDVRLVPDKTPARLPALLSQAIALVLTLGGALGVLLLSFGWSFAWHWFAHWQIPFGSLGLGPDLLLEYGRIVVVHFWWLAVLWLLFIGFAAWAIDRRRGGTLPLAVLVVAAFLIPWLFSHYLGGKAAEAEIREARSANFAVFPEAQVLLHPSNAQALPESILDLLSNGPNLCYRLLLRSSDGLWLIRLGSAGLPIAAVFLPNNAFVYLRLRHPSGGEC